MPHEPAKTQAIPARPRTGVNAPRTGVNSRRGSLAAAVRVLAVAAMVAIPVVLVEAPQAEAATVRKLVINTASASPTVAFKGFDGNPPKVVDLNGDGQLEIIAQNDNQYAYIFDSKSGKLLAELKTVLPSGWGARSFNGPEAAIMDGGGTMRVILANSAATITSYRLDAVASTTLHLAFVKEWQKRLTDCHSNPGMDSKPVLADLDRDGDLEILAGTEESGVYALRMDGTTMWKKCIGGGNSEPTVGDLNRDGWPDVVHASDGGVVTAMNGRTGATMWGFHTLSRFNLHSASMPVGPAIGQLDGVGGPDVVVGARDSHDAEDWSQDHAMLIALDSGGKLLWAKQDPTGNPLTYTHAIIGDAAKDGEPEVYWADWNTIGHKPPANEADSWKVTGPANFYRYDKAGNLVWKQSLGTFWSNKDTPIADVDGDGVQEMLANGPNSQGHDGIWTLDTNTGAKESFIDAYPWKVQRAPVVADLYGTGLMQFVLPASPAASGAGSGGAILVYDMQVPYSALWPHLPDPRIGTPVPPPPPPAGSFDATFTLKNPNSWWQEVAVKPATSRTITGVDIRIPGSDWMPMSKSSWGAWTSSHHTPAGTQVEFLAHDSASHVSQSAPFTWLDGTLTKGSVTPGSPPPPPPPTAFTASFKVPSSVNEWWVEVAVSANDPVSAVAAQVDGGSWVGLTLQDWGNWAKSFHVNPGQAVVFRATSSAGAQAFSAPVNWMGAAPPPTGGPFTASFAPQAVGNDWWLEVKVTANEPLAGVDVRRNGGSWSALTLQDWGNWAKSLNAPNGTLVEFRARAQDGDTALSAPVTWA